MASSRKTMIEEADDDEFDDDTDLPLPGAGRTLPNLGPKGALLEEINIETEPTGAPEAAPRRVVRSAPAPSPSSAPVPAPTPGLMDPNHPLFQQFLAANRAAGGGRDPQIVDPNSPEAMEKYKKWTCIYPIYIDAKRAYGTGQRRVAREKALWWPKSQDILTAAASLNLNVLHEPQKCHPRDWENPGRVKVLWKQDGKLLNPAVPTKKKLFEYISGYIQRQKPDQVPDISKLSVNDESNEPHKRPPLPKPPQPLPPLTERHSMYSPLVSSGALLEGWKVGTGEKPAAPDPTGGGKGKRKVIRIRQ